jgi:FKBP-type peptidyl-prolyl cis-trans isomerase FkpA
MKTSACIALVSALLVMSCGGAPEPPPASTSAPPSQTATADKPAPEPAKPAETPPAPPPKAAAAPTSKPATADKPKLPPANPAYTRTDLEVGAGAAAQKGRNLSVHYTGWLYDNTKPEMKGRMFDSSKDRGPFNFQLGAGQVIPGWDQGFDGMKVGGRRRLIIPASLGYGVDGAGGGIIPPNATLLFEMELLDVK